jgi:hypothetical protein
VLVAGLFIKLKIMTVREKLESMLVANGMFEKQAKEVIELSIPKLNELADDYTITFESPSNQYPDMIYKLWYVTIKPIALKWIDDNKPMAWFREMFV